MGVELQGRQFLGVSPVWFCYKSLFVKLTKLNVVSHSPVRNSVPPQAVPRDLLAMSKAAECSQNCLKSEIFTSFVAHLTAKAVFGDKIHKMSECFLNKIQ